MKKKLFLLILAITSIVSFKAYSAINYSNKNLLQVGAPICVLEKKLDLNAYQKSEIQILREASILKQKEDWQKIVKTRLQLRDVLRIKPVDETRFSLLLNQQKEYLGDLIAHRIQLNRSTMDLLTEEQREIAYKYSDLIFGT